MNKKKVLKSTEISYVLNHGKVVRGKYINIHFIQHQETKIAFLINRRIRGAVRRNRVRRRIREAWRLLNLEINKNVHICLYAKTNAEKSPFSYLQNDIEKLLKKIEVCYRNENKIRNII